METLRLTLGGLARYNGRMGQFNFIMHRLTGLGTVAFLLIHIVDTSFVYFLPELYSHAIGLYRSVPFMLMEIGLVFSLFYHGINGARIAFFDLVAPAAWERDNHTRNAIVTWGLTLLLWVPAAIWMFRSLLIHNFGMGG